MEFLDTIYFLVLTSVFIYLYNGARIRDSWNHIANVYVYLFEKGSLFGSFHIPSCIISKTDSMRTNIFFGTWHKGISEYNLFLDHVSIRLYNDSGIRQSYSWWFQHFSSVKWLFDHIIQQCWRRFCHWTVAAWQGLQSVSVCCCLFFNFVKGFASKTVQYLSHATPH